MPGYKKELEEVKRRRLREVSPEEMQEAVKEEEKSKQGQNHRSPKEKEGEI